MGFIETLIHLPTVEQWHLLKPLILLMQVFFLPFMGLVIVSTLLSVAFRVTGRPEGLSRDMIDLGLRHPAAWLIFGVLPLVAMLFLYSQLLFGLPIQITAYLTRILGLVVLGCILLWVYRRALNPAVGGLAALVLIGAMYHFVATMSLIAVPERWELVELPLPFFHSYQPIIHFNIFLAGAFLFTGAAAQIAFFHWPERQVNTPSADQPFVARVAYGLLILGILPLPALLVVDFATAPFFTLDPNVFGLAFWMLAVLLVLGVLILSMVTKQHTRYAWPSFVMSLVFLGLFAGRQQSQISVGDRENELATLRHVEEIRAAIVSAREELYASAAQLPADAGEQIYNRICTSCHSFETRVVGPPYNEVLAKYVDNLDELAGFVFNPVKVSADYPAMPNQGLKRAEARAVAEYLLTRFTGQSVTGAQGAQR